MRESSKHAIDWADRVVRARYLVASLGEAASPPWWRTEATTPAGQRMLARLFPRTFLSASLETAARAARVEHDARIGRVGAFHLFRLPTADESELHDWLGEPRGSTVLQELAGMGGPEERLAALRGLAEAVPREPARGPVHCGTIGELRRGHALDRICAAFAAGFESGNAVYPYLTEGKA